MTRNRLLLGVVRGATRPLAALVALAALACVVVLDPSLDDILAPDEPAPEVASRISQPWIPPVLTLQAPLPEIDVTPLLPRPEVEKLLATLLRDDGGSVEDNGQQPAEPRTDGDRSADRPLVLPFPAAARRPPAPQLVEPAAGPPGSMKVAIVIDDLGPSPRLVARAAALPAPMTLSFLPYASNLAELTSAALEHGHEVFVHLPMQPEGDADPGPQALTVDLPDQEIRARTRMAIERVPGATGLNNHMGSRFTAERRGLAAAFAEVRAHDLVFVDSLTTPRSVAARTAISLGIPATSRDVFLDNDSSPAAIRRQLALAESIARERGSVVAIGHPYPSTLAELARWGEEAPRHGVELVRASDVVRLRSCTLDPTAANACVFAASVEASH